MEDGAKYDAKRVVTREWWGPCDNTIWKNGEIQIYCMIFSTIFFQPPRISTLCLPRVVHCIIDQEKYQVVSPRIKVLKVAKR